MANIITTLHPENDESTNLYPNIVKENIPNKAISMDNLDDDITNLLNEAHELHVDGVNTSTNILAFTENKGIWVGSDTGHWYYWDGTQYVSGGVYQAIQATYSSLDTDLKEHIKLVDIFKNTLYVIKSISISSSDYTNGNYQYDFSDVIPEGYAVGLKVAAQSYGYITVAIQNGNTSSGVSISSTLVNAGDVLEVTGTIQNGNANRVYVYSPNTVVCNIEVLYANDIEKLNDDMKNVKSIIYPKEYNFNIIASNYSNNSYFYKLSKTLKENTFVTLKVTAQSYGYIAVTIQNGNTSSGVSISSTLVNAGDVLEVTGTIQNGNADRVYVYSPNTVACKIEIYTNVKTLLEQLKYNEIIVDANGKGDYTSLDDALKYANDSVNNPVVITIRAGIYNCRTETPTDTPYQKNNRYLVIRGEDVNNTIIRNDNGYYSPYTSDSGGLLYDSSPIRISGNVTIENLTIISTDTNYTEWLSEHPDCAGLIGAQSYCVHTDFDCDENTTTLIRNCRMKNNHHCCIGAGTRKNHLIQIENCELETTNYSSLDGATIFAHSYNLNSGNAYEGQKILVKNNIITNTNKVKSCYFYASSPDRIYATLINNVSKTSDTQNGFVSYGDAYGVTLTDYCYGNNIITMNK